MTDRVKYIVYSLLDFALTFGGTAAVIVANYLDKNSGAGYKLALSGVVLAVAVLLSAKAMFEKSYREKYDTLLQQMAEATSTDLKRVIAEKLNAHKIKNNIYQRMMTLLPFAILYVVTWLGAQSLSNLHSTVGLILASMGAGSVFNVAKKPVYEKMSLEKMENKAHGR